MATDPYDVVKSEIQTGLQSASSLLSSFKRIRSTASDDNEELQYAKSELKATLTTLEADLDDLEESVNIVEETGARMFGLDDAEVVKRRRYVQQVRRELENIRGVLASSEGSSSNSAKTLPPRNGRGPAVPTQGDVVGEDGEDDQAAWSRAEQQMILREQDEAIDSISGTVATLAEQAGLMGREISEHVDLLDDLEQNVDRVDSRMTKSLKRLQKFIRDTEETKSGWCIGILIVILMVLLLMVILI